jgi:hypothetical protein
VVLVLAACASTSPSTPARENFKRVMDRQVGKSIDDPDAYPVYYRLKQLTTKTLPNGNVQSIYAAGRDGKCQVGYELNLSRQIVGWSIVDKPEDCVIAPPRP